MDDYIEHMNNLKWKEFKPTKVRAFQLDDEPQVIYVIKIREDEYMVVHEDPFYSRTGETEFLNKERLKERFGIDAEEVTEPVEGNIPKEWSEVFQILSDGRKNNLSELECYDQLCEKFNLKRKS